MLLLYSQCLPPPTHSTIPANLSKLYDLYHVPFPEGNRPIPPLTVPLCAQRCGHDTQISCLRHRSIGPCMFRVRAFRQARSQGDGPICVVVPNPFLCQVVRWAPDMVSGFRNPVYPASSLSAGAFQDIVDHHTKTFLCCDDVGSFFQTNGTPFPKQCGSMVLYNVCFSLVWQYDCA